MATKTRRNLPEATSAFVFRGTVKKIRSATMKEVPVSNRTAVVRVEQVLEATKSFAHYEGQDITVELAGNKKVAAGDEFIFHANSWIFGDSVAVRAVTQEPVTQARSVLLKRGGDPAEHRKARQVQEQVDTADLVVSGRVAAVTVPPEPAERARAVGAPPPAMPVSEHDPKWRQAVIQVDETYKGRHDSKQVTVLFPASTDVRWYRAPKFQAGQKGLFILHKTKIKTEEHHELRGLVAKGVRGAEVEVYTALHPADVHPLKQQAAIKAMIR
jgi:hypothetical protein